MATLSAALYVIWGLLHLQAAYAVYRLGSSLEPGMLQGRMVQHAWNLLFASVVAIFVAITMNSRNSREGYWLNTVLVGLVDMGFILFLLIPGYLPLWPGLLGPVAWLLAWGLSTVACVKTAKAGA
ncbi:hypothetical protein [Cupriavidus sp. CP313]